MPAAEDLNMNFPFSVETNDAVPAFGSTNTITTPIADPFAPPKAATPPADPFAPPKADTTKSNSTDTAPAAPAEPKADASATADAEKKDAPASADASAPADKKDEPAAPSEQPMITADTKIEQPLVVNE